VRSTPADRTSRDGVHEPVTRRGPPSWLALLGWVALAASAGAIGAIASRDAGEFYATLVKPTWAPPGWLFGPVWTTLYLLMGIAAWLVWRARPTTPAGQSSRRVGLALFVGQLVLNALWTWLFFAWREGALAFGEIVLLAFAVLVTTWHFGRVRPPAAYCFVPYLGWVSFATALTWAVWQRNPGQL
jgi:tryptophan-rich sensory protein